MTARLILVRHGQTHSNVARRLDTRPPGAELTELGHRQAREYATALTTSPTVVVSSVAVRARQTAAHIAEITGAPHLVRDGLQETHVGELEDRTGDEDHARFTEVYQRWLHGDTGARIPGGESADEVLARYVPVLEELRREYLTDDDASVHVVSHGAAIRLVTAAVSDVDADFAADNHLDNTGSIELHPRADGTWECVRWGSWTPPFEAKGSRTPDDPMG